MRYLKRSAIGAALGAVTLVHAASCGHAHEPPSKHAITADDPTPALPTYVPRAPAGAAEPGLDRGPAGSGPQAPAPPGSSRPPLSAAAAIAPPPAAPPDNEFGYDEPVEGCFSGEIYALPARTYKLPTAYEGLERLTTLYACEWDISHRDFRKGFPNLPDRIEWFAIRYTGKFRVKHDGKYLFRLLSDDGSRLQIDGQVVVDHDGAHVATSRSGEVTLTQGEHTLTLEYFQGQRFHIALQVFVTPPAGKEHIFTARPAEAFARP